MTFSIVGRDSKTGELGVAVATKFIAVGASVPHADYQVGTVAVQAEHHPFFGRQVMALLEEGICPEKAVKKVLIEDDRRGSRQLGVVDAQGRAFSYTGSDCGYWSGGRCVENAAAQGNGLVNEATVTAMIEYFQESQEPLPYRLLGALTAGEHAGGDSRGKQSAALYVAYKPGGMTLFDYGLLDLRVDDHPEPYMELYRLLNVRARLWGGFQEDNVVRVNEKICRQIQKSLYALGYYDEKITGIYDAATIKALRRFCYRENLRKRIDENARFDQVVLDWLTHKGRSL